MLLKMPPMAEWLGQASQGDEVYCHTWRSWVQAKVSLNLIHVLLLCKSYMKPKISIASASIFLTESCAYEITSNLHDNVEVHFR